MYCSYYFSLVPNDAPVCDMLSVSLSVVVVDPIAVSEVGGGVLVKIVVMGQGVITLPGF